MFVGHGRKVKPLCDESAIATKQKADKMKEMVGKPRSHITSVLLERDLRRLGSCAITCGLLG